MPMTLQVQLGIHTVGSWSGGHCEHHCGKLFKRIVTNS